MAERLKALREAESSFDFWGLDEPKCPHCGHECSVSDNEWLELYEEGEHEVECPACELEFTVSVRVSYSFSTDTQEDV
jgi:transcription elongation factor Elf1